MSRTVCPSLATFCTARSIAKYSTRAGTLLAPIVSRKTMITPTKIMLTRLRPRWRRAGASRSPCIGRRAPICALLLETTDTSDIAEIHPYEKRVPDDVSIRHEAPESTVFAVVAIVAHDEVTSLGDRTCHAPVTVDASVGICMLHCNM